MLAAMRPPRARVPVSSLAAHAVAAAAAPLLALALGAPRDARAAGGAAETALLPPIAAWNGASRALVAAPDDPWITPCEASGLTRTPRYDETIAWLRRLDDASPDMTMVSLGQSAEGRDLWMAIVARGGGATPEALRGGGRPTVLVQAGIHAGEIDGKDAGMMLLRDLTVRGTKRALLDRANLLFVPIFNADGHERFSPFGRINQRGPVECGWRTTARNLNLNRDYAKADTPEMRAMIGALNAWDPDLYIDVHVTDGFDCQYDVTWGSCPTYGYSPRIAAWMTERLDPAVSRDLEAMGHVPGALAFPVDYEDPSKGLWEGTTPPRFSHGYGDVRHLPTILVENHSLKPFDRRVLGTYVFLESVLREVGADRDALRAGIAADRARRATRIALAWKRPDRKPATRRLLAIASRRSLSAISGRIRVEWTGEEIVQELPVIAESEPAAFVSRPVAYWVPAAWTEVIERLALHGIRMERTDAERTLDAEVYRIADAKLAAEPFEGRAVVTGTPAAETCRVSFAPGSVRVPTDQPLGDLAMILLEPGSGDSFFRWGFFLETMQRTEYVEAYVMEPMAERMLAEDPALRAEFEKTLAEDSKFAASGADRLDWFYRKTPYYDARWGLYPIARELAGPEPSRAR
jgi:hypothetical protein